MQRVPIERGRAPKRYRTTRLEAFSDAVFAIAITLLVLEIAVPAGSQDDLLGAFLAQWPSYLAYLVSFATIGSIWLAHNAITDQLDGVDATFLRLNLLLLLFVSFLPFPTRLLAEHLDAEAAERVAVTVYGLNLLFCSATLAGLWAWAGRAHLRRAELDEEEAKYLARRLTPGLGGYVVILAVGLLAPRVAVIGYLAIAVFFLVPVGEIRGANGASGDRPPT
jgi:uncharacterized membrane protein